MPDDGFAFLIKIQPEKLLNQMKTLLTPTKFLCTLVLLAFGAGCATTQQTENLLSAAGFKTVIANTAKQQKHLASLPAGKITTVQKKGITYFVYPDAKKNQMFVGMQKQYTAYQNLRLTQQLSNENLMAAQMNEDAAAWNSWNGWGTGWGF